MNILDAADQSLFSTGFCRAMICKCGLCRHAVMSFRLSMCLSVTFVDSVRTNKYIFIFSQSGSHTILVFPY